MVAFGCQHQRGNVSIPLLDSRIARGFRRLRVHRSDQFGGPLATTQEVSVDGYWPWHLGHITQWIDLVIGRLSGPDVDLSGSG
jgi:hypothetical protein